MEWLTGSLPKGSCGNRESAEGVQWALFNPGY